MIQEIKLKNFLSFKDEVKFSFEASNDKFAEDSQVVRINENTRLLRFAIVYGYNASGKSNILRVFDFLCRFWFYKPENLDEKTGIIPFKLDQQSPEEPSKIELVFYVGNTKYQYQLELDERQVYLEKLSYYNSIQPTKLFERKLENGQSVINFNLKVNNIVKDSIAVYCLKNMSFFAARNQVNASIPPIDAAMDWMKANVMQTISPDLDLTRYAQRKTSDNKELIKYILDFLHEADFNITNIKTEIINQTISDDFANFVLDSEVLPENDKERIKKEKTIKQFRTGFEHTVENERGAETYLLSFEKNEESRGTIRTFGLESALYNAMQRNAFLAIDEIETSLHPKLLEKILFEYLKTNSRSQILVTTHNDGLLDLADDLIRKDSVWFTEKDKAGVTDLYKLTDFRGVNRLSSIREAYRNKRFGATMK
ncbi:MAG: ATP-binding protein [Bacteroidales bacterium]|nr:ATP-binding protein [Bacteroidales bacterium]